MPTAKGRVRIAASSRDGQFRQEGNGGQLDESCLNQPGTVEAGPGSNGGWMAGSIGIAPPGIVCASHALHGLHELLHGAPRYPVRYLWQQQPETDASTIETAVKKNNLFIAVISGNMSSVNHYSECESDNSTTRPVMCKRNMVIFLISQDFFPTALFKKSYISTFGFCDLRCDARLRKMGSDVQAIRTTRRQR